MSQAELILSKELTNKMIDFARQLDEGLITKSEYLNAMLNALAEERQKDAEKAHNKLGFWMSAALSDPNVCEAMKTDIQHWMEVNYHLQKIPDLESGTPGATLPK